MKPDNPQHELPDELLSAYLDAELSAAEQAAVEERLKSDPAALALVEELRAVSQAVQALPERGLDEDLRRAVLRRAEVQMLCGDSSTDGEQSGAGGGNLLGGSGGAASGPAFPFSIGRSMQGWVWSAAAIAAAVMIMIFGQQADQPERRQVALQDAAPEQRAAPELRSVPQDGSELASSAMEKSLAQADVVERAEAEESEGLAGLDSSADDNLDSAVAVDRLGVTRQPQSPSPAAEEAQLALSASSGGRQVLEARPDRSSGPEAARAAPSEFTAQSEPSVLLAGDEVLVVQLQSSPIAQRSRRFEATLVSHGIVIEESGTPRLGFDIASDSQVSPQPGLPAQENVPAADALASSDRRDALDENISRVRELPADEGAAAPADGEPAGVALYFVEAPAEDMLALLTDLNADRQNFTALQIDGGLVDTRAADSGPAANEAGEVFNEEAGEALAQRREEMNRSLNTRDETEAQEPGQSRLAWVEGGLQELERLNRGVIPARQRELNRELFGDRDLPGLNAVPLAAADESAPGDPNASPPSDSQAARSQIQGAEILEVDAAPDASAIASNQPAQGLGRGRRGRGGRGGGFRGGGRGRGLAFEANNEAPAAGNQPVDDASATPSAPESEQIAVAERGLFAETPASDAEQRFGREAGAPQAEASLDSSQPGSAGFQPIQNAPALQQSELQQNLQDRESASRPVPSAQPAEQRGRARRLAIVELTDSRSPQTMYSTRGLDLQQQVSRQSGQQSQQGQASAGGSQAGQTGNGDLPAQPERVAGRRGRRGLGGGGFGGGGVRRGGRPVGSAGASAGDEVAQARSNRAAESSSPERDAAGPAAEPAGPATPPARRLDAYFYRQANGAPGQVRVFFVVAAEADEPAPPTPAASSPAAAPSP